MKRTNEPYNHMINVPTH